MVNGRLGPHHRQLGGREAAATTAIRANDIFPCDAIDVDFLLRAA